MSEQHEIEIEGTRFRMVQLGGLDGRNLAMRVMRAVGPMAEKVADPAALTPGVVMGVFSSVSEADLNAIADTLGKVSQVEVGDDRWKHLTREVQNDVFRGRQKLQFFWLGKAIGYQLADFFG